MRRGIFGFDIWFYGIVALLLAVCQQPLVLGGLMLFVMLVEKDLNAEALSNAIDRIMSDDLLRASMHSASLALGKPNASEDILNWCDEMKR